MKKTLQEEKERYLQIVEATNMAYGFKPSENTEGIELPLKPKEDNSAPMGYYKDDDDAKLRSMKSQALSFKKPKWEDEPEKEFERGKEFGMLPQELRHKDVYTKDEVGLILKTLGKQIDESGNYRIYDLEHFLGIHKEN